jgi:hypothetical protein
MLTGVRAEIQSVSERLETNPSLGGEGNARNMGNK